MSDNKLCECDYCGVLRVYEAGKSCPGCGAPLTPGERGASPKSESDTSNAWLALQQQAMMQRQDTQSEYYARMLGMQNQQRYGMFGSYLPEYLFGLGPYGRSMK